MTVKETLPINCLKAFFLWLAFLLVAVAGGVLREKFLAPALGPPAARALETLLVCLVIFGLIYRQVGRLPGVGKVALFKLGLFWTVLTVAFEGGFGHYVMGVSWEALAADYNVFQGRLWPLVLLVTLLGPLLARAAGEQFHGH